MIRGSKTFWLVFAGLLVVLLIVWWFKVWPQIVNLSAPVRNGA